MAWQCLTSAEIFSEVWGSILPSGGWNANDQARGSHRWIGGLVDRWIGVEETDGNWLVLQVKHRGFPWLSCRFAKKNERSGAWSILEPVVISNRIALVCRSHKKGCLWTRLPFSGRKRVIVAGIRLQDYSYFAPLLAGQHLISTGLSDSVTEVRSNSLIDWDGNTYSTNVGNTIIHHLPNHHFSRWDVYHSQSLAGKNGSQFYPRRSPRWQWWQPLPRGGQGAKNHATSAEGQTRRGCPWAEEVMEKGRGNHV